MVGNADPAPPDHITGRGFANERWAGPLHPAHRQRTHVRNLAANRDGEAAANRPRARSRPAVRFSQARRSLKSSEGIDPRIVGPAPARRSKPIGRTLRFCFCFSLSFLSLLFSLFLHVPLVPGREPETSDDILSIPRV